MAKYQIKYLTKPSSEFVNFLVCFDDALSIDEGTKFVADFLNDRNNFALCIYRNSKLSGVAFFKNDEEKKRIIAKKQCFKDEDDAQYSLDYIIGRFAFYTFFIPDKAIQNSKIESVYKRRGSKVHHEEFGEVYIIKAKNFNTSTML
jgi:hypothetical protein